MNNRPQILTLNLKPSVIKDLKKKFFNIYEGSLGQLINTKNKNKEFKYCLLNYDFPPNLHEYDIIIVDFDNYEKINYSEELNERGNNKSGNNSYIICEHPQTLFDPRAFSSHLLAEQINEMMKHESMLIVFQSEYEEIDYRIVEKKGNYPKTLSNKRYGLYDFLPIFPFEKNKVGQETKVVSNNQTLNSFLKKYNSDFSYELVFKHPRKWDGNTHKLDSSFSPLLVNRNNEVISFFSYANNCSLFVFPKLPDNSNFITEFLENIAPGITPSLFPYATENVWTNQTEYSLPNNKKLNQEKELLTKEFQEKIRKKETEIQINTEKFKFLHQILTETGDELVTATIQFLNWLEFSNVKDMDEEDSTKLEEDIQIETNKGLLVIEVKGIGGTSKDTECSQISKIKYRRAEERGKFDVYGLYIVNHQKHLPPLERKSQPFTKDQISDAINDKRGLLTTFQLFNLYFDITNGIISKEEAQTCLFNYGLIKFIPNNLKLIGSVQESFSKGLVSIINLKDIKIEVGKELFIEHNGKFGLTKILELKLDDKSVINASNGEIGIKTDRKINKKSKIWIKT